MSSKWAQAVGGPGGGSQQRAHQAATDEYDDESINLASLQEAKPAQGSVHGGRTRRILVPFGRSSTLKSGSLQDLKLANQANNGGGGSGGGDASDSSNQINKQQQRPKLLRQRSSRAADGGSSQALNASLAGTTSQPAPVRAERQHLTRNPFRSSKSMLLLAQNQHIPQATAQLESFMSKQQADFINYAQYAAANAAAQNQWRNEHHTSQQAEWPHQQALLGQYAASEIGGHHQPPVLSSQHSSSQSISHHSQPMIMKHHGHHQAAGVTVGHQQTDHASTNALSSEQCNEQDNEDRPNCMQIMKKLFFSLVLGTVIAICWVMIIHTLKWIAIRGSEFEASQLQLQLQAVGGGGALAPSNYQSQQQQPQQQTTGGPAAISTTNNNLDQPPPPAVENIHQAGAANLLLAHQARYEHKQDNNLPAQRRRQTRPQSAGTTRSADLYRANGTSDQGRGEPAFVSSFDDSSRRKRRRRAHDDGDEQPPAQPPADEAGSNFDKSKVLASIEKQSEPRARADSGGRRRELAQAATSQPVTVSSNLGEGEESDDLDSASSSDREFATGASGTLGGLEQTAAASASMSLPEPTQPFESSSQMGGGGGGGGEGSQMGEQVAAAAAQAGDANTLVYRAPFFTSWFVSVWNILFMPVFTLISSCCFRNEDSTTKKLLVESISQFMDNGLTTLQFLGRCAFFSVLWIGTIFGIVYSLTYLDATVVMALFACSAALVYLLSWVLLHQQFVGVRIVAVIICTTGIALLAYMDNSRTLGSVLIVAGSAMCSAVYKVIYQRMFGFWSIAQMSLFFTLIGLFNAFLMWPLALLLYFLGVELIVWRHIPWIHLTAAGALHLTANIVAYFGPICSYDIFLTMGLLFAVVLSAVIDVTFYKITFFGMKLAGVVLLMIGFLVCLLPENWNEYLYDLANERFIRWKKQRSMKKNRNKVQDMSTGQMSRLRTPSGRVK